MKVFFKTLLISFLLANHSYSQNRDNKNPINKIFPETPDITSFHKSNFSPTNLYNGKLNINVPIYNVKCGNIEVPISLNYNTGGIKVDEIASNVGLGWNLNAGGSIIHIVKDIPDEEMYVKAYTEPRGDDLYEVISLGYHRRDYDYDDSKDEIGRVLPNNRKYKRNYSNFIDSSPDLYHLVAPNLNTKFIVLSDDPIKKTTTRGKHNFFSRQFKTTFLDNNSLKMDDNNLHYSIFDAPNILNKEYGETGTYTNPSKYQEYHEAKYLDSFKVTNSDGLIYEFKIGNVTETDTEVGSGFGLQTRNYNKRVTSWNLHSITNPITNKQVLFEYDVYSINTIDKVIGINIEAYTTSKQFHFLATKGLRAKNSIMKKVFPRVTRLKKITFDKGVVEFKYRYWRLDYPDNSLSEIVVKDNTERKVKGYQLIHDYFNSKENCTTRKCKRLQLKELRVTDATLNIEDQIILNKYSFLYNENEKLPNTRYSLEKDYLGYYNKNGAGHLSVDENETHFLYNYINRKPTLYYYPDQYELSLLPFKKKSVTNTNKFGTWPPESSIGFSLEPNLQASLVASLKKITYPTGGSLELTYENNSFQFEGFNYNAPGLRIKKQVLNDGQGNLETYNYEYTELNGKSSGYFVNIPTFGYINQIFDTTGNVPRFRSDFTIAAFLNPKSGYEITDGSTIGYARIKEYQAGNGYKIHKYSSPKEYPNQRGNRYGVSQSIYSDFLIKNSSFPGKAYINDDSRRGKLLEITTFNENSSRVSKETREYNYTKYDSINTRYIGDYTFFPFRKNRFHDYTDFKKEVDKMVTFSARLIEDSKIYVERNISTKIEKFSFTSEGTIKTSNTMLFDPYYPFLKKEVIQKSNGREASEEMIYPYEVNSNETNRLTDLNIISSPIKTIKKKEENSISTHRNFSLINNFPYLSSLSSKKDNGNEFINVTFNKYNTENGNILQYTSNDGIKTSILWGYNKNLPVLKVKNVSYDEMDTWLLEKYNKPLSYISQLSNKFHNNTYKEYFKTWINRLRELISQKRPESLITNYTYDPLIGVTSITDPRGEVIYYEYDDFNRLEFVKDSQRNILKEYKYKYKN